jgi:hypothetical protein
MTMNQYKYIIILCTIITLECAFFTYLLFRNAVDPKTTQGGVVKTFSEPFPTQAPKFFPQGTSPKLQGN